MVLMATILISSSILPFSQQNTAAEFAVLSRHVRLVPSDDAPSSSSPSLSPLRPAGVFRSATGLHWFCEDPRTLVRLWCSQFAQSIDQHPTSSRVRCLSSLMVVCPGVVDRLQVCCLQLYLGCKLLWVNCLSAISIRVVSFP